MPIDQNIETMRVMIKNLLYCRTLADTMMCQDEKIATTSIYQKIEEAIMWAEGYKEDLENTKAVICKATIR